MQSERILVENLKCGGCAKTVETALMKIEGVEKVDVDLEDGAVTFSGEGELPKDNVIRRLSKLGYPEAGTGNQMQKMKSYVSCAVGKMS